MRLFVSLSYNGASFSGWQSQLNAPSVQDEVERTLSIAFAQPVSVVGAGRTDAGVNARNYIAHFDIEDGTVLDAQATLRKCNAILHKSICFHAFYKVAADAHARFDAVRRTYRYHLHTAKDPFAVNSLYFKFPAPDVEKMNRAAEYLLGEHDFSSFEKVGSDNTSSICTVYEAFWEKIDGSHLVFTVSANRFLRNMVRAIVGTLLETGGSRHDEIWVLEVLEARDRGKAGQSVPGEALFLEEVAYPYELTELK